jgi:hypothetical protein
MTANRPIRSAFLVPTQETVNNHWILDAVFCEAYSRWGGRQSLLVPYGQDDQPLDNRFTDWLEKYDPDYIYSYIRLTNQQILDLDKLCSPIVFRQHKLRGDKPTRWRDYTPQTTYGIRPVASLSTISSPHTRQIISNSESGPKRILTQRLPVDENRFFADNFGVSHHTSTVTYGNKGVYETLCYCADDTPENEYVGDHRISDEIELLSTIATSNLRTFSELSAMHGNGTEHPWEYQYQSAMNLFIGTKVIDRINFWNSRHFMGHYEANAYTSLIVAPKQFDSQDSVTAETFVRVAMGRPKCAFLVQN